MSLTHSSIIPLIGGETIGAEQAFGHRPDYLMSYSPFKANDSHLLNHYDNEVEYVVLDQGGVVPHKVDVVGSVCPCAGLSMMTVGRGAENPNNQWLQRATEHVLGTMKPAVFWGENAPNLATDKGEPVRRAMYDFGRQHGYTMSMYRTKSLLHGLPQIRERSFFFFWRGTRVPVLHYYRRPHPRLEDLLDSITSNSLNEPVKKGAPSADPYYQYILKGVLGGVTHAEFQKHLRDTTDVSVEVFHYVEENGIPFSAMAEWLDANGYAEKAATVWAKQKKVDVGLGVMRKSVYVPCNFMQALISPIISRMTHHSEDRYVTYREAMTIMGMPADFELLNPKRSWNHICQNVPVPTARDMAHEIQEALEGRRHWLTEPYMLQRNHNMTEEFGEPFAREPGATLESLLD